jgi:hypothetical protein
MPVLSRSAMLLWLFFAASAAWAQNDVSAKASVSGVVRDASTGLPIKDAEVRGLSGSKRAIEATTDSNGRFTLDGLDPGQARIRAFHFFLGGDATTVVNLRPGLNPDPIEIQLRTGGHISGRVLDPDGKPLARVSVRALRRVWMMGKLMYLAVGSDDTRADGQYYIDGLPSGREYILQARIDRTSDPKAISDVSQDPAARKQIWAPTYYPNADSPERALAIPLESNDDRGKMDIRMLRSPSFCVSGEASLPGAAGSLHFRLSDRPPSDGDSTGELGPDGKFRICDLYPGAFRLFVNVQNGRPAAGVQGESAITIVDRDLDNVGVSPVTRAIPVSGQILWSGAPEQLTAGAQLMLNVLALDGALLFPESSGRFAIPGKFSLNAPLLGDEIALRVQDVPGNAYVKQISYNGAIIANGALIPKTPGALLIVLSPDGVRIGVKVTDKDGNPLPESNIALIPGSPDSEAALALSVLTGKTDLQGNWTSNLLAPGKYSVLATNSPLDESYESIENLWRSRTEAQTIDLAPGSAATMSVVRSSRR